MHMSLFRVFWWIFFLLLDRNLNPFSTNVPLIYHLKTSENHQSLYVFRGIEVEHWLKMVADRSCVADRPLVSVKKNCPEILVYIFNVMFCSNLVNFISLWRTRRFPFRMRLVEGFDHWLKNLLNSVISIFFSIYAEFLGQPTSY